MSPEHVANSFHLTQELRPNNEEVNYEDKLQVMCQQTRRAHSLAVVKALWLRVRLRLHIVCFSAAFVFENQSKVYQRGSHHQGDLIVSDNAMKMLHRGTNTANTVQ